MLKANGSPNTSDASSNVIPCFAKLASAFLISHSNFIARCAFLGNYWSFHSGIRPGVQGAPAASICFSNFCRSTSINCRS